ncbi:hypothetical protein EZS27_026274, partial [termite gut metagenome]
GYQDYSHKGYQVSQRLSRFDPDYMWEPLLYLDINEIEPGTITIDVAIIVLAGK